jgi:hypothetical protein
VGPLWGDKGRWVECLGTGGPGSRDHVIFASTPKGISIGARDMVLVDEESDYESDSDEEGKQPFFDLLAMEIDAELQLVELLDGVADVALRLSIRQGCKLTAQVLLGSGDELLEDLALDAQCKAVLENMVRMATNLFPKFPMSRDEARRVVSKAFEAGDLAFGVADAIKWAKEEGWVGISEHLIEADSAAFEAAGHDLGELARQRLAKVADQRFSVARVEEHVNPLNRWYSKLLPLGEDFPILLDPDYLFNGGVPGWSAHG